ncbi:MAG: NAD(P)-dependent oxidoreductase, partial [Blastocatellia bacterium]|nr:NAD(P)-dependent oxidoreductase [Blastocatellia bacterium]
MNTLVTGGSGYLGTFIRDYFTADNLSRRSGLDVTDPDDASIAGDYDLVIHLAAHLDKSPEAEKRVFATNIDGTVNVLRSMKKDAVFIFASTKDVYGRFADNHRLVPETCETLYNGQSAFEWSKLIAERYVEFYAHKNQFRSCIFRASTIYAPDSFGNLPSFVGHFLNTIQRGDTLTIPGGGRPVRDLLYVEDLAQACKAFADSIIRHGLYNLGGGPNNAM